MLNKLKRISKLLSRYLLLIFVLTLISVSVFLRNLKMVMIEYAPIKKTDSLFSAIRIVLSIPLSEVHAICYRSPHNPLKKSIFFKS